MIEAISPTDVGMALSVAYFLGTAWFLLTDDGGRKVRLRTLEELGLTGEEERGHTRFGGTWDGLSVQGSRAPDALESVRLQVTVTGLRTDAAWVVRAWGVELHRGALPSVRALLLLRASPRASWSLRDGRLDFALEVLARADLRDPLSHVRAVARELAAPSGPPAPEPSFDQPRVFAAVASDRRVPVADRLAALRALEAGKDAEAVEQTARACLDAADPAVVHAALRLVARSPYGYRLGALLRARAADGAVPGPLAAAVAAHVTSEDTGLLLDLLARAADTDAASAVAERLRAMAGPAEVPRLDGLRDHAAGHVRRAADAVLAAVRDRAGTGAGALSLADPGVEGGLTLTPQDASGGVSVTDPPAD